jgi:hypothetical protein
VTTDLRIATATPSPGAERMRRHRWLKRQGAVNINLFVGADAIQTLIELCWLDPAARGTADAVVAAVIDLATVSLALRVTRRTRGIY